MVEETGFIKPSGVAQRLLSSHVRDIQSIVRSMHVSHIHGRGMGEESGFIKPSGVGQRLLSSYVQDSLP